VSVPLPRGCEADNQPLPTGEVKTKKRRRLRKKAVCNSQKAWEAARKDAWLRELLTDSSGEDSDGGYSRFEASSKWIAEMGEQLVEANP
jgi:hypothetical protein